MDTKRKIRRAILAYLVQADLPEKVTHIWAFARGYCHEDLALLDVVDELTRLEAIGVLEQQGGEFELK